MGTQAIKFVQQYFKRSKESERAGKMRTSIIRSNVRNSLGFSTELTIVSSVNRAYATFACDLNDIVHDLFRV